MAYYVIADAYEILKKPDPNYNHSPYIVQYFILIAVGLTCLQFYWFGMILIVLKDALNSNTSLKNDVPKNK
jgi:hypothetical protein